MCFAFVKISLAHLLPARPVAFVISSYVVNPKVLVQTENHEFSESELY